MRIPPDVTALLIKIRDFVFVFGPILLIAVTLLATLLTLFTSASPLIGRRKPTGRKWGELFQAFLQAGLPDREKLRELFGYGFPLPPPKKPAGVGTLLREGGAINLSLGALLTAVVLSPVLVVVRLGGGLVFFLLGRTRQSGKNNLEKPTYAETVQKPADITWPIPPSAKSATTSLTDKSVQASVPKVKVRGETAQPEKVLSRFWHFWSREFDYYLGRTIYNFLLAALLTIFVPLRVIESWFGPGQWSGPLLVPLVGLLLRPGAPGTEAALVLALFIKGAGTGSGSAALLAFPLLSLVGVAQRWQYYGFKPTLKYVSLAWLVASGTGLLLEILGVNANV